MPVRLIPRPAPLEILNAAVARGLHCGRDGLAAIKRPVEIHREDGVPVGIGDVLKRMADLAHDSTGVVDENVDAAACFESLVDHGPHSGAICNIENAGANWSWLVFCQAHGFFQFVAKHVAGDDARA